MTSKKLMEMRKTIVLKFAWGEEDDSVDDIGLAVRSHDSVSLPNGVDKNSDTTSIVAVVGGNLVNDCVRLNDSFIGPSLSAIKHMSLRDNGLIQKAIGIPPNVMLFVSMQNVINFHQY